MGILDEIGDDDEDFLDIEWKSESERAEDVLGRFLAEPAEPYLVDRVRQALDEEGISYRRVILEIEDGTAFLRVVLSDGTEVSFP